MKRSMFAIMMIGVLSFGTVGTTVFQAATLNPTSAHVAQSSKDEAKEAAKAAEKAAKAERKAAEEAAKAERKAAEEAAKAAEKAAKAKGKEAEAAAKAERKAAEEAAKAAEKAAKEAAKAAEKAAKEAAKKEAEEATEEDGSLFGNARVMFVTRAEIEEATGLQLTFNNIFAVQQALTDATVWEELGFDEADAQNIATRVMWSSNQARGILQSMSRNGYLSFKVILVFNGQVNIGSGKAY